MGSVWPGIQLQPPCTQLRSARPQDVVHWGSLGTDAAPQAPATRAIGCSPTECGVMGYHLFYRAMQPYGMRVFAIGSRDIGTLARQRCHGRFSTQVLSASPPISIASRTPEATSRYARLARSMSSSLVDARIHKASISNAAVACWFGVSKEGAHAASTSQPSVLCVGA